MSHQEIQNAYQHSCINYLKEKNKQFEQELK